VPNNQYKVKRERPAAAAAAAAAVGCCLTLGPTPVTHPSRLMVF